MSKNKEFDSSTTSQGRTSFLIEDILYRERGQGEEDHFHALDPADNFPPNPGRMKIIDELNHKSAYSNKSINSNMCGVVEKRAMETKTSPYGYFQSSAGCAVQGFQAPENSGYIQVMGALGAYLGTPYKTMTDPYFLTQGESNIKEKF